MKEQTELTQNGGAEGAQAGGRGSTSAQGAALRLFDRLRASKAQGAAQAGAQQAAGQAAASDATIAGGAGVSEEQAQAQAEGIDLTNLAEFRKWQANRDRREAAMQAQYERRLREMQEAQTRQQAELAQLRLANADPEEAAAYWQEQYERQQAEIARQTQQAEVGQTVRTLGETLLEAYGLTAETPGLDWGDGNPTLQNLERLRASVKAVAEEQKAALEAERKRAQDAAVRTAQNQALEQAGVTPVSTATGGAGSANPIEDVTDPGDLLAMAFGGSGGGA